MGLIIIESITYDKRFPKIVLFEWYWQHVQIKVVTLSSMLLVIDNTSDSLRESRPISLGDGIGAISPELIFKKLKTVHALWKQHNIFSNQWLNLKKKTQSLFTIMIPTHRLLEISHLIQTMKFYIQRFPPEQIEPLMHMQMMSSR